MSEASRASGVPRRFYGPGDRVSSPLVGESVAVLGYGNLGRTVALNLRDSGVTVRIGNRDDEYAARARDEGFAVVSVAEASGDDVVAIMIPDEVIPEVFAETIGPALSPKAAIVFGSGYNLAYGLIAPPESVDVLLVAPRMAGETARQRFLDGDGFWAYVNVERDASGRARQRMLGFATALGALAAGALEMSSEMEATLDLYIEQTVGPLLGQAILTAFAVGAEAGIPAEALVLEMYMSGEMETVLQSFRRFGIFEASEVHGPTALFGGMIRTLELDQGALAERFRAVLEDIRAGGFARKFQEERANGYPMLAVAREFGASVPGVADAERAVRANSERT